MRLSRTADWEGGCEGRVAGESCGGAGSRAYRGKEGKGRIDARRPWPSGGLPVPAQCQNSRAGAGATAPVVVVSGRDLRALLRRRLLQHSASHAGIGGEDRLQGHCSGAGSRNPALAATTGLWSTAHVRAKWRGPPAPIPPPMTARAGAYLDGLAQGDASEGGGGQGSSHVGGSCGRHHRAAIAAGERRGAWRARSGSRPQQGTSGAGIGLLKASPEPLDCPYPAAPHWRPTCDGRAAKGWVGLEGGAGGRNAPIDCSQGLGRSGQLLPYHPRLFWHKRQKPAARTAR